jgi:phosphatidylglycerol:prolipoprotein diacylglycerol transferase
MHPILLELFGIKIYSYGLMVGLAYLLGFAIICARAKRAGDNPDNFLEAAIWFIIAGIGGARIFYFFWFPKIFIRDPIGSMFSSGGLVWYGGVIAVLLATYIFTSIKRIRLLHFMDVVAPGAAVGLAIGRIGCLLAGCCFGSVCHLPWAIQYPMTHETHGLPVHPAPLYETALMLLVAGFLYYLERKAAAKRQASSRYRNDVTMLEGTTSAWFFILSGIVRFIVEGVRGDRLIWLIFPLFGQKVDLSASQLISLGGILIGLGIFLYQKKKQIPSTLV